jgi:hypothetical protein
MWSSHFGFLGALVLKLHLQVAASHLDTVLEKLKNILDNAGQSALQRYLYGPFGTRNLFYIANLTANNAEIAANNAKLEVSRLCLSSHIHLYGQFCAQSK